MSIHFGTAYLADHRTGNGVVAQRFVKEQEGLGYEPVPEGPFDDEAQQEIYNREAELLNTDKAYVSRPLPRRGDQQSTLVWIPAPLQREVGIRSGREESPDSPSEPYDIVVINNNGASDEMQKASDIDRNLYRLYVFGQRVIKGDFDDQGEAQGIQRPDGNLSRNATRAFRRKLYDKLVQPQIDAIQKQINALIKSAEPVPVEHREYNIKGQVNGNPFEIVGPRDKVLAKLREVGHSNPVKGLSDYDQESYPTTSQEG